MRATWLIGLLEINCVHPTSDLPSHISDWSGLLCPKLCLAVTIPALSTVLLMRKNIASSDWLDLTKWVTSGYLASHTAVSFQKVDPTFKDEKASG